MVEQRITAAQRRRIAYASLPELPTPDPTDPADPGAATHDHAATGGLTSHDATGVGPLGVGLHPAATITPDPAGDQAAGGPTTPPLTNITASGDNPQTMGGVS
jgi:hypothetical protein